jgi:hypothetical protein
MLPNFSMRRLMLPVLIVGCATIFFACSKSKPTEEKKDVSEIHRRRPGSADSIFYTIHYNNADQITKIDLAVPATNQANTFFDVAYSGNEILMTQPVLNTSSQTRTDSIHLIMEGNNRLVKRIQHSYVRQPSGVNNNWYYFDDTTSYQYNPDGFLVKEIQSHVDSNWYGGSSQTIIYRFNAETFIPSPMGMRYLFILYGIRQRQHARLVPLL